MRIRLLAIATFLSLGVANVMLNASGPTLAQVEREIISSDVEIGVVFDRSGAQIARFQGSATAVSIPSDVCNAHQGYTFTHNHVGINHGALSIDDIRRAVWCDFRQIRVVAWNAAGRKVTCVATKRGLSWPPLYTTLDESIAMFASFRWQKFKSVPDALNDGWRRYLPKRGISYTCS